MEFAPRTYRMNGDGYNKAITIETIDHGREVKISIENGLGITYKNSINIPEAVARCIRDHLNTYLNE